MCMHFCYLDCLEVRLCCYIENLLHLLKLFYFHFMTYLLTLPHNYVIDTSVMLTKLCILKVYMVLLSKFKIACMISCFTFSSSWVSPFGFWICSWFTCIHLIALNCSNSCCPDSSSNNNLKEHFKFKAFWAEIPTTFVACLTMISGSQCEMAINEWITKDMNGSGRGQSEIFITSVFSWKERGKTTKVLGIVDVSAEIRSRHFPDTSQRLSWGCYPTAPRCN